MKNAIVIILAFCMGLGIKIAIAFSINAKKTPLPPAPPATSNRIFALIPPPKNRPAPGHFAAAN